MLILTRKKQETIQIGDDILIKIVRVSGGTVKVGIESPKGLKVLRGELLKKGESENADVS